MWKLMNRLFGFDYIQWSNFADHGVARVYRDGTGCAYYWRYRNICVADRITKANQVIWLTCAPEKYLGATHA